MDKFIQIFHGGIAAAGAYLTHMLGGWDMALQFLVTFMIIDYVTGIIAAVKSKNLNSEVMFWGGIRKGATLAVIAVAVMLDNLLGNQDPVLRTMAIYYYISREGLSSTENLGKIGVPLPSFITNVLEQLNDKKSNEKEGGK